jgi:hypothetical protein
VIFENLNTEFLGRNEKSPGRVFSGNHTKSSILDFPLIAPHNTSKKLNPSKLTGGNIYFGTGLVTSDDLGVGIPFDFLGMLLTAEWTRRITGAPKIIHEISDIHAWENSAYDLEAIQNLAKLEKEQFIELATALGLEDVYSCIFASEYQHQGIFEDIQAEVNCLSARDTPSYMRRQSAGNLYFARHENVHYKIGWLTDDNEIPTGLDERIFNNTYDALNVQPLCFLYTWCGRNFDVRRPRVSPYTLVGSDKRLMLDSKNTAIEEIRNLMDGCPNKKISHHTVMHLARILTAYDMMFNSHGSDFWTNTPDNDTKRFIEVLNLKSWVRGTHIDIASLAGRIDEIRSLAAPIPTYAGLLYAVEDFLSSQTLPS